MIRDIYLVPHSHTNISYTHPQPIVLELHRRFLDRAMDLADATAHHTDGSAFRWMVEVSGTAQDWWRRAASAERDRFVAAAKADRIEVTGMRCFGHAVRLQQQAFNWISPTGTLLVHNGPMYGSTKSGWLGILTDLDKTRRMVPQLANLLEQRPIRLQGMSRGVTVASPDEACAVNDETLSLTVPARAWTGLRAQIA